MKENLIWTEEISKLPLHVRQVYTLVLTNIDCVLFVVKIHFSNWCTSQTLKLTGLLERFISLYPTVNGESRQVRELLEVVKEKLKTAIDNDVYIPFGYPKQ